MTQNNLALKLEDFEEQNLLIKKKTRLLHFVRNDESTWSENK